MQKRQKRQFKFVCFRKKLYFCTRKKQYGGLAQLARALAWHARGHRFDSDILHKKNRERGLSVKG